MEINKKAFELGNKRSIIREIFEYSKLRAKEIGLENVFDFSLGNPSVKPPKIVKETILDLINNEDETLLHGYTSAQGDVNVRTIIADNLNNKFNVNLTANQIYMTCGAAASLSISLKAICNKDDECIVFAPFFTEYRVFVENAQAKLVVCKPNDDFQVDLVGFESKINNKTKAVIVNSPNNPSGVVYSQETIKGITDILKRKSIEFNKVIYLITDEPYRELVYDDVKVPFVMHYYDNTILCYSFSKALSLPGERIGYIAVNNKMSNYNEIYLAICGAGRSLGYVCAPSLFQKVVAKCIDFTSDIDEYKQNRDLLYNGLSKLGFNCIKPEGAFYLFVKCKNNNAFEFYEQAKKHEILVVPCDDFGVEGFVRIAYCVDKNTIKNSLSAFEKFAKEYLA